MKLLLCVSSLNDIKGFFESFSASLQVHSSFKFLHSTKILHHEVDVLETGVGVYQTTYKLTRVLTQQKYHLALKVGFGNSYKEEIAIGSVLNIVNEKPGDFGMMLHGEWKDHYDLNLINREDVPHLRGGFINLANAYMDVFVPFKKVVGVTVNNYSDKETFLLCKEKYKADCETGDGLGFVYPCLFEKQSFYQLCVIERNLATGEENFEEAKQVLNTTLIDLLSKL